jgi:hypothetical protein
MAALLQITETDMKEILGSSGQGDKMVSNISGKAVEMIQTRLDMQTFIYMSNFAKGMKRAGEIWLSMAKDIYVEEGRKMKVIGRTEDVNTVELMKPMVSDTGEVILENDLSRAKFDVNVDVGPSSSSKRAATVRALTGMMAITDDPQTKQVLQAMAMMNMEGEGIGEEAQMLMEEQQMRGQQQDPQAVFLQAAAEEATAKASQARASVIKTVADAGLSKAKTAETLAKTGVEQQNMVMTEIEAAQQAVQGQEIQPVVR